MGAFKDMNQDDEIEKLDKRLRKLEQKQNGGEGMLSNMLRNLESKECTFEYDGAYGVVDCKVLEVEEEWIKILVHEKKKDTTRIIRIQSIESIEVKD